ncbi:hypothetical protein UlMin_025516 [Ulmus minor]
MAQSAVVSSGFSHFFILLFSSITLISIPISSSEPQQLTNPPNFDSEISLFGDAELVDNGSSVKLTRPSVSSSGLLLRRKPFRFLGLNLRNPTSFSTEFTFSISPGDGHGLAFVLVPRDFGSKLSGQATFGISGEKNGNVGVDVGSFVSVSVGNVSSMNFVLNNDEKLKAWIDYEASSKRLEVRLGKSGGARPYSPIIVYAIDMLAMWKDENVLVGLSSSNGDSSQQICSVYSWKFSLRNFPNWMHSLPADPRGQPGEQGKHLGAQKRRVCALDILGGLIFATVCGALMTFAVVFLWTVFAADRHTIFPAESPLHPVDFRYEKVSVVVEKDFDSVKN